MTIFLSLLSLFTILVVYHMSNAFWLLNRIARATSLILHDENYLRTIITHQIIYQPPPHIGKYSALPHPSGYGYVMGWFEYADHKAIFDNWKMLRIVLSLIVIISGVIGYFAFSLFGLLLPILNFLIIMFKHNKSMNGDIGEVPIEHAKEKIQMRALILHKWLRANPEEVLEWINQNPHMSSLSKVVSSID